MEFPMLFSPIKIGRMEVGNRFVMPPMLTNLANQDGTISEALIEYFAARARGGWGLMIVAISGVDPLAKAMPNQIGLWSDHFIPGLEKLANTAHRHSNKIAIQIFHAGRQTSQEYIGAQPVAPSAIPCPRCKEMPRELTAGEVWDLVEKFGDAAVRAREAGFDAVELHGAHGYLVAQFISAYSNRRTDIFGGSLTNRIRFPVEIIKNIRRKTRSDFPIIFRFGPEERVTGGMAVEESKAAARFIQQAGADAIHVTTGHYGGLHYGNIQYVYAIAPASVPPGFNLPAAAEVKKSVSVPVIAACRINDPLLAEDALSSRKADLISWGRASLADPELPNKVASGDLDDIRPCIVCLQGCMRHPETTICLVNPFTGREAELKLRPATKKKHVVVAGGGPAGLEAAWIAASRGHEVTLYEKKGSLGGQFRTARIPPGKQEFGKFISYLVHMGEKHGVCFKLETEATPERILAEKPDAVVLATGAEPLIPNIKGISGPKVVTAWDVLDGKKPVGEKVLVVGGGLVGAETADFLGEHGHQVTIVEMLPEIAEDVHASPRVFLLDRLKAYAVRVETGAVVEEFLENGVLARKDGEEFRLTGFDTIVLAMGARSVHGLQKGLKDKVAEMHIIGDAAKPRKALEAVEEGARVALKL